MTDDIKSTKPEPDNECDKIDCDQFIEVDCNDGKNCANSALLPCEAWDKTCADCGGGPDKSTRFGGFNRPLCLGCRGKENARIDRFVYLYGDMSPHMVPDMQETLDAMRESGYL